MIDDNEYFILAIEQTQSLRSRSVTVIKTYARAKVIIIDDGGE